MKKQTTYYAKPDEIRRSWILIDAKDQILGRLATNVANILRGKHKPSFTPSMDTGDFVVIINADLIKVTGNKTTDKNYYRHSGFPGGLKTIAFKDLLAKHPTRVIELAVKGMLPHNRLGRSVFTKLKVYAGENHPHEAQNPSVLDLA